LASTQESAWGIDSPRVDLPPDDQNRQNHFAHWSIGGNGGFKNAQERAFLIKLMNEIKDVAGGAPELTQTSTSPGPMNSNGVAS